MTREGLELLRRRVRTDTEALRIADAAKNRIEKLESDLAWLTSGKRSLYDMHCRFNGFDSIMQAAKEAAIKEVQVLLYAGKADFENM